MSAYASISDLIARFGAREIIQLTNRSGVAVADATLELVVTGGNTSSIDNAELAAARSIPKTVERALVDAEAVIESYLADRYPLPLEIVPQRLEAAASDIARYYLHVDGAGEAVEERYKEAVGWLRDVAARRASLGVDAKDEEPPETAAPRVSAPPRRFSHEQLSEAGFRL